MTPPLSAEYRRHVKQETILLEKRAFAGLLNILTVFGAKSLSTLSEHLAMPGGKGIDQILQKISFFVHLASLWVIQAVSTKFLHLILQAYFAARHFKWAWTMEQDFMLFKLPAGERENMHPIDFLQRYKYFEKFDVVWWFVAGLMTSDKDRLTKYFEEIQTEPLDLLGPAHHRLLMCCLFEKPSSLQSFRTPIETKLSCWACFEHSLRRDAQNALHLWFLVGEMEFPTNGISKILQEDKPGFTSYLFKVMNSRHRTLTDIIQKAFSFSRALWIRSSR
jgi:hypothetical protein